MSLGAMGFASTSQIQRANNLGSRRNACRILNDLSPYLNSFREYENIYYLNKKGADRIGTADVKDKNSQYKHYLLRNMVYIHYGCPSTWRVEYFVRVGLTQIIADAMFEENNKINLVEVDNTQKMIVNERKIETYAKIKETGKIQDRLGYFPNLIWITLTDIRRKKLIKLCNDYKLKSCIYTEHDLS